MYICPLTGFLTKLQDAGAAEQARAYVGRLHPGDGSKWVENPENIFSGRKDPRISHVLAEAV